MIWNPAGRHPALTAEELAAAMREGLESRRFFRKSPPPQPEAPCPPPPPGHLYDLLADEVVGAPMALRDVPLPGGRGLRGRVIRLVRRVVRKVLRPWLDHQDWVNAARVEHAERLARFDRALFWHLETLRGYLGGLAHQIQTLQREVFGEVLPGYMSANTRLNECFHDLYKLRQLLGQSEAADGAAPPLAHPLHVAEGLFLHTRLPAPPARVLTLSAAHALDLASLGFQVVSAAPAGANHPELRSASRGESSPLALPDAAFEVVVALSGDGLGAGAAEPWTVEGGPAREELARVLIPGGTVIGSARTGEEAPTAAEVAALVAPFRPVEVAYAARAGDGWVLHPEPVPGGEAVLWVAVRQ